MEAAPTAEERAAVDELLGPPETGWVRRPSGAQPISASSAPGARRASSDTSCCRPCTRSRRASAGSAAGAELRLPAALGPARRRLRRGDVLRDVQRRGAARQRGPRLRRPRVPGSRRPRPLRGARADAGPEGADAGGWTWVRSPCLGMCEQAPAVFAQRAGRPEVALGGATRATVDGIVAPDSAVVCAGGVGAPQTADAECARRPAAAAARRRRRSHVHRRLSRARRVSRRSARRTSWVRTAVIEAVTEAKLLGRGGAAFPTGVKWQAVSHPARGPHYVICNADESEPGTFKDRVVMEQDPFAVVEALTIAGFACGAEQGSCTSAASTRSRPSASSTRSPRPGATAPSGEDVMGSEPRSTSSSAVAPAPTSAARRRRCSTRSRASAASRGTSRRSPVTHGLFGRPTAINNVETLINVLEVLRDRGRRLRCDRHRGFHRAQALLPLRCTSNDPVSTRSSTGRPSGT